MLSANSCRIIAQTGLYDHTRLNGSAYKPFTGRHVRICNVNAGIRNAITHTALAILGISDSKRIDNFRFGVGQHRISDTATSLAEVSQYLCAIVADGCDPETRVGQPVVSAVQLDELTLAKGSPIRGKKGSAPYFLLRTGGILAAYRQ
jgi:hypothetical protein